MGEMGCFPSRGAPEHWKGAVCRHQPHDGWRRVSPGGSSRRGSSSPLGGNYYPRRTPSPPAGRTGTAPHTPRPPGPALLPEANQPRRGAGAQTARKIRAAPSCPPPRGLLSVDSDSATAPGSAPERSRIALAPAGRVIFREVQATAGGASPAGPWLYPLRPRSL